MKKTICFFFALLITALCLQAEEKDLIALEKDLINTSEYNLTGALTIDDKDRIWLGLKNNSAIQGKYGLLEVTPYYTKLHRFPGYYDMSVNEIIIDMDGVMHFSAGNAAYGKMNPYGEIEITVDPDAQGMIHISYTDNHFGVYDEQGTEIYGINASYEESMVRCGYNDPYCGFKCDLDSRENRWCLEQDEEGNYALYRYGEEDLSNPLSYLVNGLPTLLTKNGIDIAEEEFKNGGYYHQYAEGQWLLYMPAYNYIVVHESEKNSADEITVLDSADFSSLTYSDGTVSFGTYNGSQFQGYDLSNHSYTVDQETVSGFYQQYDNDSWFLYIPSSDYLLFHKTGNTSEEEGALSYTDEYRPFYVYYGRDWISFYPSNE